jgi:DNA-binding transcriptional MerR regulator
MLSDSDDLDLADLAKAADVTPRTIRYYVNLGLLPAAGTRGPGTKYDRALLDRLQLIKLLQREHWPLAKIREHLETLDEEGVRRELGAPPELPLGSVSEPALSYVRGLLGPDSHALRERPRPYGDEPGSKWQVSRSTWDRIRLSRDVELSIRRPLSREQNKLIDRLLEAARTIFTEEP